MKNEQKFKKDEITKNILLAVAGIAGTAALLTIAAMAPNSLQMLKLFKTGNKNQIKRAAKRMVNQKLVEIYEKDGEEIVKITEKGKQKILKFKLNEIKINRQKKWDGLWRIVAFDIPEKQKMARDAFRIKLQDMGFLKIQQSVFIFPFSCRNEIDFVAEFFNIKKCVNYIEATNLENEHRIKNYFQI